MAINVKDLVAAAFTTARGLVPTAMPEVTVRLGPTTTINPVTEESSTAWQHEATANPVAYQAENERENAPTETSVRSFAVPIGELPAGLPIDQTGQIQEGATLWHVYRVETDPTGNLAIFHARRT